jgi:hypothetical protein
MSPAGPAKHNTTISEQNDFPNASFQAFRGGRSSRLVLLAAPHIYLPPKSQLTVLGFVMIKKRCDIALLMLSKTISNWAAKP